MKTRSTAILAALLCLAACTWFGPPRFALHPRADRNVLLLTIDTLRADALGSYGGKAVTPHLDRLAAGGARFTFAHAHAVVTLVSHASMLTGEYPYEHGIRDNTGYRLPSTARTLATRLKSQGFSTGAFIGGFPLDHRFGLNVGFDVYDDHLGSPAGGDEPADRERRADAVVASALQWIGAQQGKFLAWVHVYDPHAPYNPPGEWATRFAGDPYLGEVSWTDSALGPLFDRLRSLSRPTLVIVTGDHGESLGEHGEATHSVFAYESTLHVPLIVTELVQGAAAHRGVTIDSPVRHVDLLPTVLDAVQAPADPALPGASLLPAIADGRAADRPSYFEAMTNAVERGWAPLRGVLVGREKYIDLPIVELYDLATDPHESANTANTRPDRVRVLYETLKMFSIAPPARAQQETADTIERLRSLGYIGGGTATVHEKYTDADDPKRLIAIDQQMQHAAEAYTAGRRADAIALYKDVIAKRPDTEDAYRRLALAYWRAGNAQDAVATLESALRAGVTQREVRNKLAEYLAESGQPAKAIELLEHDTGDDPDSFVALGNAYQMAGRSAQAIATFTRLIALQPDNALGWQNLGVAQLQERQTSAAEGSLRHALQLDDSLTAAHTALGVALAASGRRDDAIAQWQRAVTLDPTDLNALYNLTVNLVEANRRDEARPYGERFLAAAPPQMQADAARIRGMLGAR